MGGFQVMKALKEIEAGGYLPVLVSTAQPDHQLRRSEPTTFVTARSQLARYRQNSASPQSTLETNHAANRLNLKLARLVLQQTVAQSPQQVW